MRPATLAQANALVSKWHRHHKPTQGHRYSLVLVDGDGVEHGAAIVGRPVSRGCDPYETFEVTRLVTDGTRNACSKLYSAAARVAKEMGADKIQTYILDSEDGTSLKASGWVMVGRTAGGLWDHTDGNPRRTDQPTMIKQRWEKVF